MGKHKNGRIIAGVAVASVGLFAAVAGGVAAKGGSGTGTGGGDSKAGALAPATCSADAFGYAGFNRSGSLVTVGAGASNDNTGSSWTITITDSVDGVVSNNDNGLVSSDWSVVQNYRASKGQHTLNVHMVSDADGVSACDTSIAFKL
jgi:hypothetical protein